MIMRTLIIILTMISSIYANGMAKEPYNFSKQEENWTWRIINDGVMGGLSRGMFRLSEDGTGIFEGNLSLENNGGFSWVRTRKGDPDFSGSEGLKLKIKGDGRTYAVTLDTSGGYNAYSFNHYFTTEKDVWKEIEIPFSDFRAYWFGRKMPLMRLPDPRKIQDIGFIIMDKKPGPFRLEIDSIGTF
jgi:monofunctional biosynthetic peptidoglycan transglycosylase